MSKGAKLMNYFKNSNFIILQKSLDAVWLRQRVISNNIANTDTPGYKSKSVSFEDSLNRAIIKSTNSKELLQRGININARVSENSATSLKENGNNVDQDKENIELARTQLHYDYLVNSLNSQLNRLKYTVTGGSL